MEIRKQRTLTPKAKVEDANLGFGQIFTDHMFTMEYDQENGWHNAAIVPYAPIELDPSAMVLHYGQAVFEGQKAYFGGEKRILLFRAEMNAARLNRSSERICIPPINEADQIQAVRELVAFDSDWMPRSPGTSLYVRPFIIATQPHLGVKPSSTYLYTIILSPVGSYYKNGMSPVRIRIEDDFVRSVRGAAGFTKASANYAISLKGQVNAMGIGFDQVLWLDGVERRYIEEVGTSNAFFLVDGQLITPELNGSILPGITRDSVINLARSWGMTVTERRIDVKELFELSRQGKLEEAFATGTAAVISPVGVLSWEDQSVTVNNGQIGAVTQKLYDTLTGIQTGHLQDDFGWVTEILL